jgi:putative ABC transport system substrate-binding protein
MQFGQLDRRSFITLFGGTTAAWPLAARAQQRAMPVIGFLNMQSPEAFVELLRGFRQGLKDTGYVEGENVAIEYRWAENQPDQLPALMADLVRRQAVVIAATGGYPPVFAAKAATTTIPIVFLAADDPVRLGFVASLARPGGNLTGINFFAEELAAKRLELLRELMPMAARIAVVVNPANVMGTETTVREAEAASRAKGLHIKVFNASTSREIDAVFTAIARERLDAIFVGPDPFFTARRLQLSLLAVLHRLPAIYPVRPFAETGGLMSYGASLNDAYRQVGVHTGRILKGAKPADLPVLQSTKFELVINAQTARMLGIDVPATLLARADEVIE